MDLQPTGKASLNVVRCNALVWCSGASTRLIIGGPTSSRHGLSAVEAHEAVDDPEPIVIDPDTHTHGASRPVGDQLRIVGGYDEQIGLTRNDLAIPSTSPDDRCAC